MQLQTWEDIFDYWKSFKVTQIEVIDFDPAVHEFLPWFHKQKKFRILENAPNDLAKHLAVGHVNSNEEIYAAFVIHATLKEFRLHDKQRMVQLREVVDEALMALDGRAVTYWHGNTKNVTPYAVTTNNLHFALMRGNVAWEDYISMTAQIWEELQKEWTILKLPNTSA